MDPVMIEAVMVRQIQQFDNSHDLTAWKRKALGDGTANGLDESARSRVNLEYKAQLAALLQVELANMP